MFKRVVLEEWIFCLPFIGFFIVFAVFALITFCALRLTRDRQDHLAALPLDDPPAPDHAAPDHTAPTRNPN